MTAEASRTHARTLARQIFCSGSLFTHSPRDAVMTPRRHHSIASEATTSCLVFTTSIMLAGRKRSSGSFGTDGRRLEGNPIVTKPRCEPSSCHSTNKLFQPGTKLIVQRAPVICGLSVPAGLQKKFQRPMTKRRAYNKSADEALKRSSLGPKRRMDGMSKLMARAGRGLSYKGPRRGESAGSGEDSEDEVEKENDRPFEPLLLWTSPHEGGEAIGLPPKT